MGRPVAVKPILERIIRAYARLPRPAARGSGALQIDTDGLQAESRFCGDPRDLQDLFGSLLENALKYADCRVAVSAREFEDGAGRRLELQLADDGDGIPAGLENLLLTRGARADTVNLGHGLGLSIAVEIVSAYGGSLRTGRSDLGGALFTVDLPAE